MKKDLNEPIHNRVQSVYLLKVQLRHKSLNKAQNMVFYKVGFSTNTHTRFDMFLKDKDLGISQIDFIDGIYAKTAKEVEKFIHKEIILFL